MKQSMSVLTSNETDEWYTPPDYIQMVREVLGEITLDPASTDVANGIVRASKYYTIADDGLSQRWYGNAFLNVPGTQNGASRWSKKMMSEYVSGNFEQGILLCFAKLGYNWFNVLLKELPVCLVYERIPFLEPETLLPKLDKSGKPVAAKHGSAFVYFGKQHDIFRRVFGRIGKMA